MKKGCLIALVTFLVLGTAGLVYYFMGQGGKGQQSWKSEKPIIADVIKKAVATGSIKPRLEVNVKPQVSGVVDELFVEAGQLIQKGQKIARIKLIPSQVNINSAQSNVELARIRLKESQRELDRQKSVVSGKLDTEDPRVSYENAQKEEKRSKSLLEQGVISAQEYDLARLEFERRKTAYENAKLSSGNTLRQFETEVDIRRQELSEAINNLQLLKEGATNNSQQVANIVLSTISGMVLDVPVEEGTSVIERNNFNEGTTIATIADMKSLIFEGKVDESDVGKLNEGIPLVLTVGAIDDHKFDAMLEYISPKGVEEEGTVKFLIKAALENPPSDIFLRAGYSANADIILDKKERVITIKERDVTYRNDSTFVDLKTGDQQFESKMVSLGISDGINVEVVDGLDTTQYIKSKIDAKADEKK